MKFPAFSDLLPLIKSGALTHVSFDIFDTFLLRRCAAPAGVYEVATHFLPPTTVGHRLAPSFLEHRRVAETNVRLIVGAAEKRAEVSIDEIYQHFPLHSYGLKNAQRPELAAAEWEAEKALCFVHDQALALYNQLQDAGVKVGFISDIYWSHQQISELLTTRVPGLRWDFLYVSSAHGFGKCDGLFKVYLKEQKLAPSRALHIGDNPQADIRSARAEGMTAFQCPQMGPREALIYQRESHVFSNAFDLANTAGYQDDAYRTWRRRVEATLPPLSPLEQLGATVMGPVMWTFDQLVQQRVADIEAEATEDGQPRKTKVVFLARDGHFPLQVWEHLGRGSAPYITINRRIALLLSQQKPEELFFYFRHTPALTYPNVEGFFKLPLPTLKSYFDRQPGGVVSGERFSQEAHTWLSQDELAAITSALQEAFKVYLYQQIPDLDDCTDLVLVDVGYGGTAQHALRDFFNHLGKPVRLHGTYLIIANEGFSAIPDGDSACGLIHDHLASPHLVMALRNNVALLELICSAPEGSVYGFTPEGEVLREDDPRSPEQLAMCESIRQGAYTFLKQAQALTAPEWQQPLSALRQRWAAASLARLLLLPTDDELVLLSTLKLDVNLGSQAQIPLIDTDITQALVIAKPPLHMFKKQSRVMWPAACLAMQSPQQGFLYSLQAAHPLPGDVMGDAPCGNASLLLVRNGQPQLLTIPCLRTSSNTLRLRISIPTPQADDVVIIPLSELALEGHVHGIAWQQGDSAAKAFVDSQPRVLPLTALEPHECSFAHGVFAASSAQGHLRISPPATGAAVGILTITLSLPGAGRLLAQEAGEG